MARELGEVHGAGECIAKRVVAAREPGVRQLQQAILGEQRDEVVELAGVVVQRVPGPQLVERDPVGQSH